MYRYPSLFPPLLKRFLYDSQVSRSLFLHLSLSLSLSFSPSLDICLVRYINNTGNCFWVVLSLFVGHQLVFEFAHKVLLFSFPVSPLSSNIFFPVKVSMFAALFCSFLRWFCYTVEITTSN